MEREYLVCEIKDCPLLPKIFKSGTQFEACQEENCIAFKNGECKHFNNTVYHIERVKLDDEYLSNCPDCNTCKNLNHSECPYNPKWGKEVVLNCYKYK